VSLELGPGDSLSSALIAAAYGGSASYLVDAGPYAQAKVRHLSGDGKVFSLEGVNERHSQPDGFGTRRSRHLSVDLPDQGIIVVTKHSESVS